MPPKTPSEIHALFLDAFNRGDIEGLVALYEPGAVLVIRGQAAVGHEAIRECYQRMFQNGGQMQLETRSVVDSGEGLAVLHASWTLQSSGSSASGVSTEVVRRQPDGTWLFVMDEPRTPD